MKKWWSETEEIFDRIVPKRMSLLCSVDGNMRVRCSEEPWIGSVVDHAGNSGTEESHLLRFVRRFGLSVVNTHEHLMDSSSSQGTFVPVGALEAVRCDYFLATFDIAVVTGSCKVDYRFR